MVGEALILIVDDDADTRELMRGLLVREGFAVHTAADGADAIESLQLQRPDAVVTDLMMPGRTGNDLVAYVRHSERLADLPIAVVSAHPDLAPAGCEVFAKPLVFKRLLSFLCRCTRPSA